MNTPAVVYKYELPLSTEVTIPDAASGPVQYLGIQHGKVMIWMVHCVGSPKRERRFVIAGTGHEFNAYGVESVGSVLDGAFVWHVFERIIWK